MSKFVNSVRGLQFIFKHYFGHWKVIFRKNKQTNKSDLKRAKKQVLMTHPDKSKLVKLLEAFEKARQVSPSQLYPKKFVILSSRGSSEHGCCL